MTDHSIAGHGHHTNTDGFFSLIKRFIASSEVLTLDDIIAFIEQCYRLHPYGVPNIIIVDCAIPLRSLLESHAARASYGGISDTFQFVYTLDSSGHVVAAARHHTCLAGQQPRDEPPQPFEPSISLAAPLPRGHDWRVTTRSCDSGTPTARSIVNVPTDIADTQLNLVRATACDLAPGGSVLSTDALFEHVLGAHLPHGFGERIFTDALVPVDFVNAIRCSMYVPAELEQKHLAAASAFARAHTDQHSVAFASSHQREWLSALDARSPASLFSFTASKFVRSLAADLPPLLAWAMHRVARLTGTPLSADLLHAQHPPVTAVAQPAAVASPPAADAANAAPRKFIDTVMTTLMGMRRLHAVISALAAYPTSTGLRTRCCAASSVPQIGTRHVRTVSLLAFVWNKHACTLGCSVVYSDEVSGNSTCLSMVLVCA